jgi:hypothetical protein
MLLLLLPSPFVSVAQAQVNTASSSQYIDHGFAALASGDRVTLSYLEASTGGNLSVGAFEKVIQGVFLPLNVREVLLDIGWQNFTVGATPYQAWVNNWFTASDVMGISNVLYVGQLTTGGIGSPWVDSLISKDPTVATYYSNGTRAPFVSLDNPEVARYLEVDLGVLFSYYGTHPSWVGLSTGSSQSNPYYANGGSMPTLGYSNVSISSFINSPYYSADVNATGYLPNGELDALWSEYRVTQSAITLSSGDWMLSSPFLVYGSGSASNYVEMRFEIPSSTNILQVQWYGNEVGTPGLLNITIFGDGNGGLSPGEKLKSVNSTTSSVNNSTGWQNGVQVTADFTAGWYWVKFASPSSDASNYYTVYAKDYLTNNATAYAQATYIGPGLQQVSTILWLKNGAGENLAIYPYQEAEIGLPGQVFTATHVFSFNTVFLFLSDRSYNPSNATLTISDVTNGGSVVATGLLSQALDQGLEGWVPISLNDTVTTVPGDEYSISVAGDAITWTTVMRYVVTDPAQAGFQNQTGTLLFQLANLDWSQGVRNWGEITLNGGSAVTSGFMDAVRFTPSANETMKSVQILMYSSQGVTQHYSSGTFSIAIWGSNADGSAPKGPPLQQLNVSATVVPQTGLLNASWFNASVSAGKDYWIVLSANSSDRFTFARLTSPFEFLVLASGNGGASWSEPSDGPTEFGFTVTLSRETVGTYVGGIVQTALTSNSLLAQPFIASSDSFVEGVYIGPLIPGPDLLISINPTGADGQPTVTPLGSGLYDAGNITLDYGPDYVQFSSVAHLQQGQEYWIVIHPKGNYQITEFAYLNSSPNVPYNSSVDVSSDNGLTWKAVSNSTNMIPDYLLEAAPTQPPQYNTRTIFSDLSTNFNSSVNSGVLRGWNAYVQTSELSTFNGVAEFMSALSGKTFEFYTDAQPNVFTQVNLKNIVVLPTAASTNDCGESLAQEESAIVSGGSQFPYATLSALQSCSANGTTALAQQLNYTPYVGQAFGLGTPTNVLVVGDQSAANLTTYLSNAFNTRYVNYSLDPTLQIQGNLSSFRAILWVSSSNETISSSAANLLTKYVRDGGELLTTDPALANMSASPAAKTNASGTTALNASFLTAAIAHTGYPDASFHTSVTNSTLVAKSTNLVISARESGHGQVVFVGFASQLIPEVGDQLVVISNIISDVSGVPLAFWYGAVDSQTPSTEAYSVDGTSGSALLVWIHNPSSSSAQFSLNLNSSYYGIPAAWKTVEVPGLNVTVGSGSSVGIEATVPAGSLVSILVVPVSYPLVDYSTATVQRQFAYPDQSLYYLQGTGNQSVLVMISTKVSANQILLDDKVSLTQTSSLVNLYSAKSGWYFDGRTDSLFVKYLSTGADTVRFVFYSPAVVPPATLPQQTDVKIFVALIAVEAVTLALLAITTRRRGKGKPSSDDS